MSVVQATGVVSMNPTDTLPESVNLVVRFVDKYYQGLAKNVYKNNSIHFRVVKATNITNSVSDIN